MALDARVHCNCLELQVLRTQPPEWQVHVTEEGGRETKATDPETQMAFEEIPAPAQVLFDHVQARLRFQADVFWTKASLDPQVPHLWLDTYQTGKISPGAGLSRWLSHDCQMISSSK